MKTSQFGLFFTLFLSFSLNHRGLALTPDAYLHNLEKKLQIEINKKPRAATHVEQLLVSFSPALSFPHLSGLFKQSIAHRTTTVAQQTSLSRDQAHLYDQAQLLIIAHLCKKESSLIMQQIFKILMTLFDSLDYWQDLRSKPFYYFTSQWPTKIWHNKSRSVTIRDGVSTLKEAIYYYTYFLGAIYKNLHKFDSINNEQELYQHVATTIFTINACVEHESFEFSINSSLKLQELHDILISSYERTYIFHTTALQNVAKYLKPGHFQRNWVRYSVLATTGLATLIYWYYNQEKISTWTDQTVQAGKKLFSDSVYQPVKNIFDSYFSKQSATKNDEIKNLRKDQTEILKSLLKEQIKKTSPHLKEEQIQQTVNTILESGTLTPELKKELIDAQNSPVITLLSPNGSLISLSIIEIRLMINQLLSVGDEKGDKLLEILHQNHVNYQLLLTFPAVLLSYLVYTGTSKAWHAFTTSEKLNPLREGLLMIENTLNKYDTKDRALPFDAQGIILYWVHKLRAYVYFLPKHHQEQFNEDLTQIGSPDFELHQKLATIDRMYRSYEFLSFGAQKTLANQTSFFRQPLVRDYPTFGYDAP